MTEELSRQFSQLPTNLANHLLITILPLSIGLLISVPLAIISVRRPRLRSPILTIVSIIQTIPSLALLALMVPMLVAVNVVLAKFFGFTISELGFYPTVIALTLYSMLPILRNTVTGILDVDPSLTEAARGVGMTKTQSLWKVELPLALPVIVAGVRTATVWTVGIATLATPVGQRCLGNYIFQGLHTRNWVAVLFGCIAAAILAVLLDSLIGGLQASIENRRTRLGVLCGTSLGILFIGGLIAPAIVRGFSRPEAAIRRNAALAEESQALRRPVVVASKSFTEQYILAELIKQRLTAAGFEVREKESLGSTIIFDALTQSEVDCYVDYTGTLWANHLGRSESAPEWEVRATIDGWLAEEKQVRDLGALGFENAYALAMRRDRAKELGIQSISDLAEHAHQLRIGGDLEFFDRPEWQAVKSVYGFTPLSRTSFASTFMYEAIRRNEVDVISAFTTDGRIESYDLIVLEDDRHAIPPYDAILLLSPEVANTPGIVKALKPLLSSINDSLMRQANALVDREDDKKSVTEAAQWLSEQIE